MLNFIFGEGNVLLNTIEKKKNHSKKILTAMISIIIYKKAPPHSIIIFFVSNQWIETNLYKKYQVTKARLRIRASVEV